MRSTYLLTSTDARLGGARSRRLSGDSRRPSDQGARLARGGEARLGAVLRTTLDVAWPLGQDRDRNI